MIQFELKPENITPYIKHLAGAVESSQVMQILAHVHLMIKQGVLTMTTSNTEMEASVTLPIHISEDITQSFTVSARKLGDILRLVSSDVVMHWVLEDQWVTITADKVQYRLASLEADRFPFIPLKEPDDVIDIPAGLLKRLIEQTAFGVAKQDIRIYLNGLLFDFTPGHITVVASDSYRMCLRTVDFEQSQHKAFQAIVPKKTVLELARLLATIPEEDQVKVSFAENIIHVAYGVWELRSHLIDAHYPP